jgi:hypothetical protein
MNIYAQSVAELPAGFPWQRLALSIAAITNIWQSDTKRTKHHRRLKTALGLTLRQIETKAQTTLAEGACDWTVEPPHEISPGVLSLAVITNPCHDLANIDLLAGMIQHLLPQGETCLITWVWYGDKARPGTPGAGGVLITGTDCHWHSLDEHMWAIQERAKAGREDQASTPAAQIETASSEETQHTAACLWEAALDQVARHTKLGHLLDELLQDHGSVTVRHAVARLAAPIEAAYQQLPQQTRNKLSNWGEWDCSIIPAMLTLATTPGRLPAITVHQAKSNLVGLLALPASSLPPVQEL